MKTGLQKKILESYIYIWIPFLIFIILMFHVVLTIQLNRQAVSMLKNQSYNSQMYTMRYLKALDEGHVAQGLHVSCAHFAKYLSETTKVRTQIYDGTNLLADSGENEIFLPRTKDVRAASETKSYAFFYYEGKKYLSFSSPILNLSGQNPNDAIGVIRFIYPLSSESAFLTKVIGIVLIISAITTYLSIILMRGYAGKLTQSLEELRKSADIMQSGDLSREISIKSDDEIEELGNTFNLMRIRLKEYIDRLDSQSEQMRQFFNNVAHQLKTPLTFIIGYSQMIQVSNNPDDICEDAFIIEEAGEKLLKNVDSIISQSRQELEWAPLHICHFNMRDLSDECIRLMLPRLKRVQIHIVNDTPKNISIQSDPEIVKEIILTLMDNAIIHSGCKTIYFSAEQKDDVSYFHVRDDGRGIKEADAKYIFTAFYRGSTDATGGTGLGLSICKSQAERIEGSIGLLPKFDSGCEFILEIPRLEF